MRALVAASGKVSEAVVTRPRAASGSVLVEVARCGICGSDIHMLDTGMLPDGHVLGHEIAGTVVEVGDEVSSVRIGDRVAVLPATVCDPADGKVCDPCSRGASQRCEQMPGSALGISVRGGYAEAVAVSASSCFKVSDEVDFDSAALIEPLAVAVHGVERVTLDDRLRVGVIGGGPIGLLTALAARSVGVRDVVVAEPSEVRREIATEVGVKSVPDAAEFHGSLGASPDVVFECAGTTDTPALAIQTVKSGGNVVILGVTGINDFLKIPSLIWVAKEVTVTTAIAYSRQDFGRAVELVDSGDIGVRSLVSSVRKLSEFDAAIEELRAGTQMKILISPEG